MTLGGVYSSRGAVEVVGASRRERGGREAGRPQRGPFLRSFPLADSRMMPTGGGEAVTVIRAGGMGKWGRICHYSVPPRGTRFFFFALFSFFVRPFGLCEDGARRRLYEITHPTQVAARDGLRDCVVMMYFCWLFFWW